ncbi:MAG: SAM-dependent methyltransferase [Candidatus Magasanikbacteria bacterium]|jgi:23S rRNA (cytosine1962-C5)-methyltransferase|nr:SAM-dependent methyltransferase [Candidatus Magasanikbacteria bacterium]MBT4071117.1 SAM-dependent methyltransferase [Candidatus Magasanikbacteria bacterium]
MNFDYELLDCGNERRLERFGKYILDRPCPQAIWKKKLDNTVWNNADAYYERTEKIKGWKNVDTLPESWEITLENVNIELRPSINNQVGIFPEQLSNWLWLEKEIKKANRPVKILNTFAYTGVATIMASQAGEDTEVCHVDGAKASVNWARKNAEISGLSNKKIRWIVDDVMKFMEREIKRGNTYDGIILDPPAFGKGGGTSWKFKQDLPKLLTLVNELLSDSPLFVILSGHAQGVSSKDLLTLLEDLPKLKGGKGEAIDLIIPSLKGNDLPSSVCGRVRF